MQINIEEQRKKGFAFDFDKIFSKGKEKDIKLCKGAMIW